MGMIPIYYGKLKMFETTNQYILYVLYICIIILSYLIK